MRNFFKNEDVKKNIFIYANSGIIIVLFFFILNNLGIVTVKIKEIFGILMPFIWGIILAFLLSSIANKIELFLLKTKLKNKSRRLLAVFSALFVMFLAITLFLLVLVPQIIMSASRLASSMSGYIISASNWINDLAIEYGITKEVVDYFLLYSKDMEKIINIILGWFQTNITSIMHLTFATISGVGSFVIGIIIAVYMLIDKEHLFRQFNKLGRAFLKDDAVYFIKDVIFLSIEKFNNFIIGKLIDSVIIGIICFIAMNVMKLDYSILISFVIGVTNIIPVFGPFIGAVPCAFILLIVDPIQALWFVIMIIILQQIDGNIIGPSILGDSMGLSSMWIMFAIIVGGGFFGVVGMFLGVPTFSVIYHLLREYADKKIAIKEKMKQIKTSE